jgi:hypothetical protein
MFKVTFCCDFDHVIVGGRRKEGIVLEYAHREAKQIRFIEIPGCVSFFSRLRKKSP